VSWWSVAASFHSIVFNIEYEYVQNISIHRRELMYVERQRDRMAQLQMTIPDSGEMSVDSPPVHLLLKKPI
jgi:heme exporter protein D